MDINFIIGFLLLAVPAFFTPGPNNLMLMTSSAKFGLKRTIPHAIGIFLGFPFMVFAIGLGLGEIFTLYPIIKTILKYLAAAYFLWMAYNLLGIKIGEMVGAERPMRLYEAALFQWINPKAWAMGVSFVAAFVVAGEGFNWSIIWLTLGCLALSPFSTIFWMVFGQQLTALLKRTGTERYLGIILAALMIIAIILFLV
ncbi:MAG: LysE family translocator [Devosiaceae bacterium]|nr:LysE family translocator [Devosiaceae bacterium]